MEKQKDTGPLLSCNIKELVKYFAQKDLKKHYQTNMEIMSGSSDLNFTQLSPIKLNTRIITGGQD